MTDQSPGAKNAWRPSQRKWLSARRATGGAAGGVATSGYESSALYGLADVSLLSLSQHLDVVRAMAGPIRLPIVADIDTGYGTAVNVDYDRAMHAEREAASPRQSTRPHVCYRQM
jgi:phosphoenolpyruvate phosphomutase